MTGRRYVRAGRLPWRPLETYIGPIVHLSGGDGNNRAYEVEAPNQHVAAELCGVSTRTVVRWVKDGVPIDRADEIAVRLGTHPALIWLNWYEIEDVA